MSDGVWVGARQDPLLEAVEVVIIPVVEERGGVVGGPVGQLFPPRAVRLHGLLRVGNKQVVLLASAPVL